MIITIDGPSGTGKGTVAECLAKALGFPHLDSGALYRALAWSVDQAAIDINNKDALEKCISDADVKMSGEQIFCDNTDISNAIREEKIGMLASKISSIPMIRRRLLQLQRDQAKPPGLVSDGRDMGTVVFPEADVKIFLTASADERAKRRYKQLKAKGIDVSLRDVEEELNTRDRRDTERDISPLKPADDAVTLDTTGLTIDQACQAALKIVRS